MIEDLKSEELVKKIDTKKTKITAISHMVAGQLEEISIPKSSGHQNRLKEYSSSTLKRNLSIIKKLIHAD